MVPLQPKTCTMQTDQLAIVFNKDSGIIVEDTEFDDVEGLYVRHTHDVGCLFRPVFVYKLNFLPLFGRALKGASPELFMNYLKPDRYYVKTLKTDPLPPLEQMTKNGILELRHVFGFGTEVETFIKEVTKVYGKRAFDSVTTLSILFSADLAQILEAFGFPNLRRVEVGTVKSFDHLRDIPPTVSELYVGDVWEVPRLSTIDLNLEVLEMPAEQTGRGGAGRELVNCCRTLVAIVYPDHDREQIRRFVTPDEPEQQTVKSRTVDVALHYDSCTKLNRVIVAQRCRENLPPKHDLVYSFNVFRSRVLK